jgi:putative ABC transport system ATP-binding protein
MSEWLLRLEGVTRRFAPERPAVLENLSFSLRQGEYVAILGESGVGKSTLLNLVAGLEAPDAGHIEVLGHSLATLDDDARSWLRRRHMGFVFQAFHVLPYLTVRQNVALPLELLDTPPDEVRERVVTLLESCGLAAHAAQSPRDLSGGELQRVAIARALANRPALLLADEPTGNLDPRTAAEVLALLKREVRAREGGGILVTHSSAAAASADRAFRLDGRSLAPL